MFNKKFNKVISTIFTYLILILIVGVLGYFFIPIVINEIKNLIPEVITLYQSLPANITNNINLSEIGLKVLKLINTCSSNVKMIVLNIFYSIFISYYFLIAHEEVSKFIAKYIPSSLICDISINLKAFVRGTILDTIILFVMSLISFSLIKMPYSLLFAIVIALTNIIPFIGPYIGGVPAILVAFSVSKEVGIIILGIIIILQFVESSFIHPIIMSKSLKINPIFIIIGLIVFSYFFGIIGMLLATPLVSIIKSIYLYYRNRRFKPLPDKQTC
jgi:predicted PurR-regulated permease PerM